MKRGRMALVALALAATQAWSADVTWNSAQDITLGPDTLTNQAFAALNAGGADVTLDGIVFKGSSAVISVDGNAWTDFIGANQGATVPAVGQDYYDLLKPANYSASKITLNNLDVGQDYLVQVWVTDCRWDSTASRLTLLDGTNAASAKVTLKESALQSAGVLGQYVVGSFVADAETQEISVFPAEGMGADTALINAVALYFITPPPEATITWSAPEDIAGSADFTSNEVFAALNVGGSALTTEGIDFSADDGSLSQIAVSGTASSGMVPDAASTIPAVSASYASLLDSAKGASSIALDGLTAGQTYFVKVWTTDATSAGVGKTATVDGVSVDENVPDSVNGLGQYVVGEFIALAAKQTIAVSGDINAVEVYVPLPPPKVGPSSITWDHARNISSGTDTLTNTVFAALNAAGSDNVTLDGITFVTNAPQITLTGDYYDQFVTGATTPPISAEYEELLASGRWSITRVTLTGLTAGQDYVIQLWSADARDFAGDRHTLVGGAVKLWENVTGTAGGLGQYVLGQFTATSNTQFIAIDPAGAEDASHALINAVAVYEGTTTFAPPPTDTPYDPAPVDWQAPQSITGDITGDSDVITTQTLVKAINVNGSETTINGVTFAADDGSADGHQYDDFLGESYTPALSSEYHALLGPANWGGSTFHIDGLTRGQRYKIQIWFNDSRGGGVTGRYIEMLDVDGNVVSDKIYQNQGAEGTTLGQYIIGTFKAAGETQTFSYKGTDDSVINAYALYEESSDLFSEWAADYGLSGVDAEQDADPDEDGLNNLDEYGLGGDPTNSADKGTTPVVWTDASDMQYVYVARTDDPHLEYYIEINDDLVFGTWTNSGYTATRGPSGTPDWESVTNTVPMGPAKKFIRLIINQTK